MVTTVGVLAVKPKKKKSGNTAGEPKTEKPVEVVEVEETAPKEGEEPEAEQE